MVRAPPALSILPFAVTLCETSVFSVFHSSPESAGIVNHIQLQKTRFPDIGRLQKGG